MPLMAEGISIDQIWPAAMVAISACVLIGLLRTAWRWVPYAPRRPVPWQAMDIVLVLAAYVVMQSVAVELARWVFASEANGGAIVDRAQEASAEHVIGRLMSEGGLGIVVLCVVSAAVVAPVAEEFLFRVLLQGWLEGLGRQWRRQMPTLRRWMPRGLGPVLLTSAVFAGMHFRVPTPPASAEVLVPVLVGDAIARSLAVIFAVGLVRWRTGATAADLGWMPQKIVEDVKLGLGAFAAIAVPVYAMQVSLTLLLKECYIVADPFPLFFLALALGTLYFRTHRILPLVVLHAALNGTSLLLAGLFGK